MGKTLSQFQVEALEAFENYQKTGTPRWDYSVAGRDLAYQVGSLTKALLQLEGIRHREGKGEDELKEKIADELADIFAEILFISHELGISLEKAWDDMRASDQRKISERQIK